MRSLLLIPLIVWSVAGNAQLTNGLVAHWNFNGNVNDVSGNGYHGTPFNISYVAGKAGQPLTAAKFNGTNSYVSVAYQSGLNVSQFSICAMIKVDGYYAGLCQANAVLWRGSQFMSGYYSLIYFDNPFTGSCFVADTSKNVFAGQVAGLTSGTGTQWQYTPTIVSHRWYCVITTFDGSQSKIYVDGILRSTYNVSAGSIGSSVEGLAMGANRFANSGAYPYWMNATLDDLRLYNRVLSKNEIDSFCNLFTATPTVPEVSISQPVSPTSFCPNDKFALHYTVTAPFNPGNTFTAQLSNAAGSFATPVNIGSVTATGAGVITCTIPAGTPAGTGYRVRVVASNPADTSADNGVNLTISSAPLIMLSGKFNICNGENLQVTANVTPANIAVNWTGPNGFTDTAKNFTITNAAPIHSGRYIITATNNGCTTKDTAYVKVDSLNFSLGNDTSLCNSSMILNPAIPGATYLWQDGSTGSTYTVSSTGQYFVQVTLGACIQADTINVKSVNIALELPADTALCPDSTLTLTAPAVYDSYIWSNGSTTNSIIINEHGSYWLKVGKEGCVAWDSILVKRLEPYFLLGNDTTICSHHTLILRATSLEGSKYRWQDGSTKQTYRVSEKGTYHVTATNICGEFWANIQVDEMQCLCVPVMPTAFTPDGNGLNDAIGPIMTCQPSKFRFTVFNRWGQQVYETEQFGNKWNGRFGGEVMGMDTYFYMIQVTDMLGNESLHKGDFHLLR